MNLNAQLDEELSFVVGDEITILEVTDNGTWYKGRLGNSVGTFPAAFVQLLSPLNGSIMENEDETLSKVNFMRTRSKSWKQDELDDVIRTKDGIPYRVKTSNKHIRTTPYNQDSIATKNGSTVMDERPTTQRAITDLTSDYNGLLDSNKTSIHTVQNIPSINTDSEQSAKGK